MGLHITLRNNTCFLFLLSMVYKYFKCFCYIYIILTIINVKKSTYGNGWLFLKSIKLTNFLNVLNYFVTSWSLFMSHLSPFFVTMSFNCVLSLYSLQSCAVWHPPPQVQDGYFIILNLWQYAFSLAYSSQRSHSGQLDFCNWLSAGSRAGCY